MAKQRKFFLNRASSIALLVLGVFWLGLANQVEVVDAYSEPTTPPTTYDATTPKFDFLNASTTTQNKTGSLVLGIGGDAAHLCLNNPLLNSGLYAASTGTNCIDSWDDLRNPTTPGAYARLSPSGSDTGFIHLKPEPGASQYWTLVLQSSARSGGAALWAGDTNYGSNPIQSNYAADFAGSIWIGSATNPKKLCLNDAVNQAGYVYPAGSGMPTSYGCITQWSDLFYSSGGIGFLGLTSPGTVAPTQTGQIAVQYGAAAASFIAGDPTGMPLANTCGDGMCNAGETGGTCAVDCGSPVQINKFVAYPGNARVYFDTYSWDTQAGPSTPLIQQVVVVRKAGSAPTAVPQTGVAYTVGQTLGDGLVVFSGPVATQVGSPESTGPFFDFDSNAITNGQKYYYIAYPATSSYRYGPGTSVTNATPNVPNTTVSIRVVPAAASANLQPLFGSGPAIFSNGPIASGQYTLGSKLIIDASAVMSGYIIGGISVSNHQGVCQPYSVTCEFVLTQAASIIVQPVQSTTGGGGGGDPGDGGCFVAGAQVTTPFGTRAIETLRVGDLVTSYDLVTGITTTSTVTKTFVHQARDYGRVVFSDGTTVIVTANHPFYDPRRGGWREIGTMSVGDSVLQTVAGSTRTVTILSAEFKSGRGTVYNIEVSPDHNYFVNGILVHNKLTDG